MSITIPYLHRKFCIIPRTLQDYSVRSVTAPVPYIIILCVLYIPRTLQRVPVPPVKYFMISVYSKFRVRIKIAGWGYVVTPPRD